MYTCGKCKDLQWKRTVSIMKPVVIREVIFRGKKGKYHLGTQIVVQEKWCPKCIEVHEAYEPELIKQFLRALDRLAFGLLLLGMGTVKRKNRYRNVLREIQNNEPVLTNNGPLALDRDEQRNILYNVS